MKLVELFQKKTVLSCEIFPPKPTSPVNTIYETLDALKDLPWDFISVTYGAGGGKNNTETIKIASAIKELGIESVAHLPCIGLTKADVLQKLDALRDAGIENILALRGDLPPEGYAPGDFRYASDLVRFIRAHGDFDIIGACYPEGHIEAESKVEDIRHLKQKVDAGAAHLITQLFFDNEQFYAFRERCQLVEIDVPIEAGIMPVTNRKQIERMTSLCGATLPKKFAAILERYEYKPEALRDAGIAYAVDQIVDLLTHDVDGIHLYTMNNPYVAERIYCAVKGLF